MSKIAEQLNIMAEEIFKRQVLESGRNKDEALMFLCRQLAVLQYYLIHRNLTQEFEEFTTEALFDIQSDRKQGNDQDSQEA